ncbi:unnamed protein product [Amoebophrya sp. A25]|nr:unnamed protein product [Amoebophrya sp. A25]|eukprot:GSA25T00001696001.1
MPATHQSLFFTESMYALAEIEAPSGSSGGGGMWARPCIAFGLVWGTYIAQMLLLSTFRSVFVGPRVVDLKDEMGELFSAKRLKELGILSDEEEKTAGKQEWKEFLLTAPEFSRQPDPNDARVFSSEGAKPAFQKVCDEWAYARGSTLINIAVILHTASALWHMAEPMRLAFWMFFISGKVPIKQARMGVGVVADVRFKGGDPKKTESLYYILTNEFVFLAVSHMYAAFYVVMIIVPGALLTWAHIATGVETMMAAKPDSLVPHIAFLFLILKIDTFFTYLTLTGQQRQELKNSGRLYMSKRSRIDEQKWTSQFLLSPFSLLGCSVIMASVWFVVNLMVPGKTLVDKQIKGIPWPELRKACSAHLTTTTYGEGAKGPSLFSIFGMFSQSKKGPEEPAPAEGGPGTAASSFLARVVVGKLAENFADGMGFVEDLGEILG